MPRIVSAPPSVIPAAPATGQYTGVVSSTDQAKGSSAWASPANPTAPAAAFTEVRPDAPARAEAPARTEALARAEAPANSEPAPGPQPAAALEPAASSESVASSGSTSGSEPAATAAPLASSDAPTKNATPTGFPNRAPSARSGRRGMPATASPADAAARSAAARSAAAASQRPESAPDHPDEPGEERRSRTPRQDSGEKSSALALFFEPEAGTDLAWPAQMMRVPHGHRADTAIPTVPHKPTKDPRSPFVGLVALLIFGFIATFFAWFSAGPLWLTLGHEHHGVATVANCPVAGIDKRCAQFIADDDEFTAQVTLLGPKGAQAHEGAKVPAEMVSSTETIAYAGDDSSLYLRWVPGLAIVLLCGFGIAWATGTFRLPGRRAKSISLLASLAGPILLAAGMLAITW